MTQWRRLLYLPQKAVIGFVRLYQMTLSPLLGNTCRFHPSCSEYMILAVEKYGVLSGVWRGSAQDSALSPVSSGRV